MARKIINALSTVVLIFLVTIVVMVFVSRMNGQSPSVFGLTFFRVQTDSMEPTLMVGDVILDKKAKAEEISVGDIVTYKCLQGELSGQTITHRVVKGPDLKDGVYYFTTQGDKKGSVPDVEISYDQIEGKFERKLQIIGKLYNFFLSPAGLIVFIGIIMVLFGYEMISLILTYKSADEHDDNYYEPKAKKPSTKRKKTKKTH